MDPVTKDPSWKEVEAAGPVMAQRRENPTGSLTSEERLALQDATLAVVREFRLGAKSADIQQKLNHHGWQPEIAEGFVSLVRQLLSKMYFQRTWIFAMVSVFTSMVASIAVPQAQANEFPWWAAIISLGISVVCILGTIRNYQLYRSYRAPA
ncbi:MAG TPA: hypothetical protein PKA06_00975 [Gemmatales bacterium]|mgnify:CR=1 FL=1|nr:hypothetical protein [Gemmatales bacterium]